WSLNRKPACAPQRPDCVAGHVRLELRNVVANYPFESSRGFPRPEPNSGHADHSRLSCSTGDTQLGLGSAGIFQQAGGTTSGLVPPDSETLITLSPPRRRRIVARIFTATAAASVARQWGCCAPQRRGVFRQSVLVPRAQLHPAPSRR